MLAADILPLLLTLFGLITVGQLLRVLGTLPANAPEVLGRVIVQITMPALLIVILAGARFESGLLPALLATTVAMFVALGLGVLWLRLVRAPRPSQGAAGIVSAFSNTAFLGLPFVLARYPGSASAATTAVVIDTVDTTILLLTVGVAFATAMASQTPPVATPRLPRVARALVRVLTQPMMIAVLIGLGLALSGRELPGLIAEPLTLVGQATTTLAFLTIGLGLDLKSLRGQTRALAGIAVIKLIIMPGLTAIILLALGVHGEVAQVAVLQAAMPTAVVAAIIATNAGCDGRLASAAAVVTTLLSLLTLPILAASLPAIGL